MVTPNSLDRAIEIMQTAIDLDVRQNYTEAYGEYLNALDHFVIALKYEKNAQLKSLIRTKINEYLDRAETLKAHSSHAGDKRARGAIGRNERGPGKIEDEDGDPELKKLRAGLSGSVLTETPNVRWDDIAGLEGAKSALKETVIITIKFPRLFSGMRRPWKGILLYGPPGTGKSYLAKAVATEAESTFFSISSSDLVSKWQGDSEKLVKQLFEMGRESKPAIIFIDEVDSLTGTRGDTESEGSRRIKTEFLVQMDGVGRDDSGVLVIGATNVPWQIDPSIKRRFEKRIYIPLPGPDARRRMFELHIGSTPSEITHKDYRTLASSTEGYSGADISIVVRDALMQPVRKFISATHFKPVPDTNPIKWTPCSPGDPQAVERTWLDVHPDELYEPTLKFGDFVKSLDSVRPTVVEADILRHDQWTKEFGSDGA